MVYNLYKEYEINKEIFYLDDNNARKVIILRNILNRLLNNPYIQDREHKLIDFLLNVTKLNLNSRDISILVKEVLSLDNFPVFNKKDINLDKNIILTGAVGSGKKGYKTMNISTPSMLVAASAGIYTAKPGSKATSSLMGSADLMRYLGVDIDISIKDMLKVLKREKFGFFSIESLIPNFDRIYGGYCYSPTILSFILPGLLTPIKLDSIVYGISHPDVKLSAHCFKHFGFSNGIFVTSTHNYLHYIDEFNVCGINKIVEIKDGEIMDERLFNPRKELKLPKYKISDLKQGKTIEQNLKYVLDLFKGNGEKAREDIVALNSAALLYSAKFVSDIKDGFEISKEIINSGKVFEKLKRIKKFIHHLPKISK